MWRYEYKHSAKLILNVRLCMQLHGIYLSKMVCTVIWVLHLEGYSMEYSKLNWHWKLTKLKKKHWVHVSKFRCQTETGRWQKTPRSDRNICLFCDGHIICDEFHYLFVIRSLRYKYIPNDYYIKYPSQEKIRRS